MGPVPHNAAGELGIYQADWQKQYFQNLWSEHELLELYHDANNPVS